MRSYAIATVHDLRRKSHTVIGERWRTHANETEIETTRAPQPAKPTLADRRRGNLASPPRGPGDGCPTAPRGLRMRATSQTAAGS
jgi:hypothetical protein